MYVYKITNNINNKIYIGITNNYKKRWQNEKTLPKNKERQQVIQRAIHKYGENNFTFEILYSGLSIEQASEKEIELIKQENSLVPNGYNVAKGGMYCISNSIKEGNENGMAKLTEEEVKIIKSHRNIPMYVLYDDFSHKISYETFKKCYHDLTYKNIPSTSEEYPYNFEFSCQFNGSPLDYSDIVFLREQYNKGVYWREVYKQYKEIYKNEWTFWNIYVGNRYKLVMPEVFTEENKHLHSGFSKSGALNGRAKLTKEDVLKIRKMWNNGTTRAELYELYPQVSATTIRGVINKKTWKNLL